MSTALTEVTMQSTGRGRHGTPKVVVGGVIVGVFVVVALFPGLVSSHDPLRQDLLHRLADPTSAHPLGTDALGRDVWSRLVHGTRVDLRVGVLCALLPMVIGTVLGGLSGFYGGILDVVVGRVIELVQSFPVLVFFLAVLGALGLAHPFLFLGPGELPIVLVFAAVGWIVYARLIRGEVMRVRDLEYVQAAGAGGLSPLRVLIRHVLPNAIGQTVVYVVLDVGLAILALATLSYLGLGVPAPVPEWGAMIAESSAYFQAQWWLVVAPGVAITVLGVGLALIGDGIDDLVKRS
jgi:peptide/nickel transport system permease protein